jgi:hypothetical protein
MFLDTYETVDVKATIKEFLDRVKVSDYVEMDYCQGLQLFKVNGWNNLTQTFELACEDDKQLLTLSVEDLFGYEPKCFKMSFEEIV